MDMVEQITAYIKESYQVEPEHPWVKYPENMTFKDKLSGKWFALIMPVKRATLGAKAGHRARIGGESSLGNESIFIINVKSDLDTIGFLSQYDGYMAGYHMNKQNWLTIFLDGTVAYDQVLDQIDRSYTMITDNPTVHIYEAVKKIPKGKVATYGDVAALAGNPKMSRAVGNALHKNPDPDHIPCYRVVNAAGLLAGRFAFGGADVQADLLRADGIEVVDNKVDLEKYRMELE